MLDATIIYCSSNREDWLFEKRIIKQLLKNSGGLPIVSVTQKPVNLGTNICVGDVGASGFNFFRQTYLGLKEAKTKYVISAEADCLYPPDYFQFKPERDDIFYRNSNIYVLALNRNYFYKKPGGSTFAQIVGREHYLKRLEELFTGCPMWSPEEKSFPKERWKKSDVWDERVFYESANPCVSFKTGKGMRNKSATEHEALPSIPYWGNGRLLKRKFINNMIEDVRVRSDFPKFFVKKGYKVGAEIGVYKGEYTEMFLKEGIKMYAIDPYVPYSEEPSQENQDELYKRTSAYLSQYPNCTLIRKTSMEAVKDFADESLDFVYIDGDHSYQNCLEDITEWAKKVRKGGVVAGHDYKGHACKYVQPAVDYYVKEHGVNLHVVATRGYMIQRGDKHASFLWIKE